MAASGLANLKLDESINRLPGISDVRLKKFSNIGVNKIRDLLDYFPSYYLNLDDAVSINKATVGDYCIVKARVEDIQTKNPKPDIKLTEVALCDGTGTVISTFFSQPWLSKKFEVGDEVIIYGKLEFSYGFKRFKSPMLLHLNDAKQNVLAMYDLPRGFSRNTLSKYISDALSYILYDFSFLPEEVTNRYKLMNLIDAYRAVHFPNDLSEVTTGSRTIKFYELFIFFAYRLKNKLLDSACEDKFNSTDIFEALSFKYKNQDNLNDAKIFTRESLEGAFNEVFDKLEDGKQAIILCPLIGIGSYDRNIRAGNRSGIAVNTSEYKSNYYCVRCENDYKNDSFQSAQTHADILRKQKFGTYSVDVVAGNPDSENNKKIIDDFLNSELDVLITTRFIEKILRHNNLGALFIEDSDRFSLSALFNLRNKLNDNCKIILIKNTKNIQISKNMETFCNSGDYMEILKLDFEMTPCGNQLPSMISGSNVLKLVDFNKDYVMSKYAYLEASKVINDDPLLKKPENKILSYELSRCFEDN